MDQLDALQEQPRDQAPFSHLIAAPAALGYLLARPNNGTARANNQDDSDSPSEPANKPQLLVSSDDNAQQWAESDPVADLDLSDAGEQSASSSTDSRQLVLAAGGTRRRQFRRSSNESVEKRRPKQLDKTGSVKRRQRRPTTTTSSKVVMAEPFSQARKGEEPDDWLQAEQSASPSSRIDHFGLGQIEAGPEEFPQGLAVDRMRMKRFNSALCLADKQHQREVDLAGVQQQQQVPIAKNELEMDANAIYRPSQQPQLWRSSGKSPGKQRPDSSQQTNAISKLKSLTPDDPMILARQRRPSVSKGSVNVDQQALFSAVECNQIERAKTILDDGKANVNSLNGDKLTCLDIAVLLRNVDMVRLLQHYGAKESSAYFTCEARANQLYALYTEARRLVEDLSRSLNGMAPISQQPNAPPTAIILQDEQGAQTTIPSVPTACTASLAGYAPTSGQLMLNTGSLLSSALFEEKRRQLQYWKRRLDLFMHMRYEFERLELPDPPELIVLQVVGENSLGVKIVHSLRGHLSRGQQDPVRVGAGLLYGPDSTRTRDVTSRAPQVVCSDPKCSHWLLGGELADSRQMNVAATLTSSKQQTINPINQQYIKQTMNTKQQKLAAFNQLLAQQLMLLSHQQQLGHQAHLGKPTGNQQSARTSADPERQVGGRAHNHPLIKLTQNNSTDSAYDSIKAASQRQPAYLAGAAISDNDGARLPAIGDPTNLDDCPSIAYRLMTAASQHGRVSERTQRQLAGQVGRADPSGRRPTRTLASEDRIIITKYKVEWSHNAQMEPILNSMIVYNTNSYPLECHISNLTNSQLYYVRVSAGNHRGFSAHRPSSPICLSPSSWRQVEGNKRRKYDEEVLRKFTKLILLNKHILDDYQSAVGAQSPGASLTGATGNQNKSSLINMLLLDATTPNGEHLKGEYKIGQQAALSGIGSNNQQVDYVQQIQQQSILSVKKNFKNLFQSNSFKFHKLNNQNKRGLYLTTVIYHFLAESAIERSQQQQQQQGGQVDKIVVTNDDRLPVIEVLNDLVSPGALMSDFYWLLKINGTQWMDIKRIRQQLQKSHSSSTLHLRIKLLSAIEQMQAALNMEDIGRLFYKPIQAHDGSIVICTCKQVSNTKLVSNLCIKWTHRHKIIPRHLRKISDSMLNSQQRDLQCQQQQDLWASRTSSAGRRERSIVELQGATNPAPTNTPSKPVIVAGEPVSTILTGATGSESRVIPCSNEKLALSAQQIAASAANIKIHNQPQKELGEQNQALRNPTWEEFKLCEHCQVALVQRRSTMASGSSSSSLASSNESQWSISGIGQNLSGRCSCTSSTARSNRSSLALTSGLATPNQQRQHLLSGSSNLLLGSTSSQRTSASARSASIMSGTPTHFSSISSRQSQAQPHFSSAQKSSTYLMLASLSLYDLLLFTLNEIIEFDQKSTVPLKRGLYLGFVQLQTTVESMRLLVPRSQPNMVPCARIRDNAHVSKEEWQYLKGFESLCGGPQVAGGQTTATGSASRHQQVVAAIERHQASNSKPPSVRTSDPSIWSNEMLAEEARELEDSGNQGDTDALGFERSRAKSVSPGLMREDGPELDLASNRQAAAQLHKASQLSGQRDQFERNPSRKELPRTVINQASVSGALSYSDLSGAQRDHKGSPGDLGEASESGLSNREATGSSDTASDSNLIHSLNKERRQSGLAASRASSPGSQKSAGNLTMNYGGSGGNNIATDDSGSNNAASQQRGSLNSFELASAGQARLMAEGSMQLEAAKPTRARSSTASSRFAVSGAQTVHQSPEETFVRLVGSAAHRLLAELKSQLPRIYDELSEEPISIVQSLNDDDNNRIYHVELIELSSQVTFVLLIPSAENVCPVTSQEKSNILANNTEYMFLPLQIFETIHIGTYEPDLLGKYSRLSAILETDLIVAQHDYRQAFSSNELKSTKHRVGRLQDMVSIADEFWRQLRWIVDVVSFARDKSAAAASGGIKLGTIRRRFELSPSHSFEHPINWVSGHYRDTVTCNTAESIGVPAQADQRSGLEIKRTTSARGSDNKDSKTGQVASGDPTASATRQHQPLAKAESSRQTTTTTSARKASSSRTDYSAIASSAGTHSSSQRRHSDDEHQSSSKAIPASGSVITPLGQVESNFPPARYSSGLSKQQLELERAGIRCTVFRCDNESNQTDRTQQDNHAARDNPQITTYIHNEEPNSEGESILDIKLRDGAEDEEAIYAYHISLKDATRAAAQRKNSQQHSTRAVAGEELDQVSLPPATRTVAAPISSNEQHQFATTLPIDWCDMLELQRKVAREKRSKINDPGESSLRERCGDCESSRPVESHCDDGQVQDSEKSIQLGESPRVRCSTHLLNDTQETSTWLPDVTITSTSGAQYHRDESRKKKRQLKTTNPFLSDSFDLT